MRAVRRALRSAVWGWFAVQLAAWLAAPTVLCAHERHATAHQASCCPGVGPGQVCPMHKTREGASKCAMSSACRPSDAALLSLFITLGVTTPAALTIAVSSSSNPIVFPREAPIAYAVPPDLPPPRI